MILSEFLQQKGMLFNIGDMARFRKGRLSEPH